MEHPENRAEPSSAGSGLAAQVRAPLPEPGVTDNEIDAESEVIWFPPASSMTTVGCVAQVEPPLPPPGWTENTSERAGHSHVEAVALGTGRA